MTLTLLAALLVSDPDSAIAAERIAVQSEYFEISAFKVHEGSTRVRQ